MRPPTALTAAASDPTGGAGVQADLKVFRSQGVTGLSAITALTVQNTRGVTRLIALPDGALLEQLQCILGDIDCDTLKIGLLPNGAAVEVLVAVLKQYHPRNVVLDPVLSSTGGFPFLDQVGQRALVSKLLPLVSLVTPNLQELGELAGVPVTDTGSEAAAAVRLLDCGSGAVLVKGGHRSGPPIDRLHRSGCPVVEFETERIDTRHSHGTGCFLSSAIAARLARGDDLEESIRRAKLLLTQGLRRPIISGEGRGSPDPFDGMLLDSRTHAWRQGSLSGIYVLTDRGRQRGLTHLEVARAAFDGGASVVQLRDDHASTVELIRWGRQLNALARERDRLFIVNDRVDVAIASDADGVHLGPEDISPADARRMMGPDRLIGVSTGTVEEAAAAAPYASYLGVGAIFGSATKLDAGAPVGPERIAAVRAAAARLPVVAIGGIDGENIAEVARAGARAAALIGAAVDTENVEMAVRNLVKRFESARSPG